MAAVTTRRWGDPNGPAPRAVARAIGATSSLGGTLAVVWTMLPHEDAGGDRVVLATAAIGLAVGVIMSTGVADRLSARWSHAVIAALQVVIATGYAAAPAPANDLRLLYLVTVPLAAFASCPRAAALHLGWVGALLAGGLAVHRAPWRDALQLWSMTLLVAVVLAVLAAHLTGTNRRRLAALERVANFDPLTGLANRAHFVELAGAALDRQRARGAGRVVLLLVDLDRFKSVNDTRGHGAGDELLLHLAGRLVEAAPRGASLARLDGDELAVLVEETTEVVDVAELIATVRAIWQHPIRLSRGLLHASACVAVAWTTGGDTASSLLRDADVAMVLAKRRGHGSAEVFTVEQRQADERRYTIAQGLHDAADAGQLRLVFQPVVELASGRLRGCEVLVRWCHPDLGEVSPAEFVPIAEDDGLVVPIGTWVLEHAIEQLGAWQRAELVPADFRMSINISGHQLHAALPRQVARVMARHRVSPDQIMIELTETVIIAASAETNDTLAELRAMGLALVLDDFGTGYSSLSHLQRARFDAVKIDRSFVRRVVEDGTDRSIVTAIMALAEALQIRVVAEGVETRDQADALRRLGCVFAQGFLFDRPLDPQQFADRLAVPTLRPSGAGVPSIGGSPEIRAASGL